MSLPVHLVPDLAGVAVGDEVGVDGDEAHHAVAVRRLRVGERVVLTDGRGVSATGAVISTGKRVFAVGVEDVARTQPPSPTVTVVQALPKGERGELAVEVLTEIGAARIVPWAAARSVAVWKGERAERSLAKWRSTAREAAKQARRSWFPEIAPLASTAEVVASVGAATTAVVLHEDGAGRLAEVELPETGELLIVVGPEGGLDAAELAAFEAAGATTVRLGAEVLRTSTAGLAAVSALLARTPRWA
ncbi:16S rRNA (uracil(1498)-N(3))-methyltransferase [Nocardioides sp. BP30]|uniref:16S rRNA (uracil(1498)-N(3))-methyltransferase n=1 Tax=Nocardioides sp. BP30 TaxID=3036374 RepID=UPI0024686242|nr:16S rRNA (uracil(1498)-N(3))-methyltransferase [Nocardioides sp. BP30]WGL51135.1 16S rRNA (uracil(1498)-N(3))-methyltransferase [Nocardioides sp. BP30]